MKTPKPLAIDLELLSGILKKEVMCATFSKTNGEERATATFKDHRRNPESINIYELEHRCENFVFELGFILFVHQASDNTYEATVVNQGTKDLNDSVYATWNHHTSSEAIFKASEWAFFNQDQV